MRSEPSQFKLLKELSHDLHGLRSAFRTSLRLLIEDRSKEEVVVTICEEGLSKLDSIVNRIDHEIDLTEEKQ